MTTSNRMQTLRGSLLLAGALVASALTGTSFAGQSDAAPTVAVRYGDLDLSSEVGAQTLYHRIASAARDVCPDAYSRDLGVVAESQRCQANAVDQAVRQLNNPKLALVHASHVSRG